MSGFSEKRAGLRGRDLWPDELPGLGRRTVGAFTRCGDCAALEHPASAGTWMRYGGRALCQTHVRARLAAAAQERSTTE